MADIKDLTSIIKELKGADYSDLLTTLDSITAKTAEARVAAKAYVESLKSGSEERLAIEQAIKDAYGAYAKTEGEALLQAQTKLTVLKQIEAVLKKSDDTAEATTNFIKTQKTLTETIVKLEKAKGKEITKSNAGASKQLQQHKKLTAAMKNVKMITAGFSFDIGSLAPALASLIPKSIVNKFNDLKEGAKDMFRDALGWAGLFTARVNPMAKMVMSLAGMVQSLFLEFSDLTTGFVKFSGQVVKGDAAVSNFTGRVIHLQRRNRMFGVTMKEVTEAYTNLTKASRTYGMLLGTNAKRNIAVADGLTEMTLRFSKVGLSAENFGQALDVLGNTYRRSDIIKQGKLLGAEFVNIGRVTGQSADVVGKNFASAMKNLAQYSLPKAKEEFRKLSIISATTGLEFGKVMEVASKFNDIEKSAEAVGELNAMMGGPYLNTLDLVNATESERVEMLKNMMTQSGESFASMDRFKKQAIAQALGTDVQEAAKLFGAPQEEIDGATKAVDKNGASYEQLSKSASKSAVSMREQMEATKQSTLLMNEAYLETHKLFKQVNYQATRLGDTFRKDIGGVVVGTLQRAKKKLMEFVGAFEQLKEGDTKSKMRLGSKIAHEALKYFVGGKGGMIFKWVVDETNAQLKGDKPNPVSSAASPGIPAVPIPPQATTVDKAATTAAATTAAATTSQVKAVIDEKTIEWLGETVGGHVKDALHGAAVYMDGNVVAKHLLGFSQA